MNKVKQFGEILTPVSLVNEMLDTLPDEVWYNSGLTWLDPCAGRNMVFPIEVYKRLMKFLPISDVKLKDKHIWNNMLFMCELQEDAITEGIEKIKQIRSEFL